MKPDLDEFEERARDKIKLREDTDGMCDRDIALRPEQVLWLVAKARLAAPVDESGGSGLSAWLAAAPEFEGRDPSGDETS